MMIVATAVLATLGVFALIIVGRAVRGARFARALRSPMATVEPRTPLEERAGDQADRMPRSASKSDAGATTSHDVSAWDPARRRLVGLSCVDAECRRS
jgi:hypothetical protein